jgi:hypothetical protein
MAAVAGARRLLRSIAAVVAGILVTVLLSLGTDFLLGALGLFPPLGKALGDPQLGVATIYRTVYALVGAYVAARLAPRSPLEHALALGTLGLIASVAGAWTMWNDPAVVGHRWYPLALVVLALPPAWLGGWLRLSQLRSQAA